MSWSISATGTPAEIYSKLALEGFNHLKGRTEAVNETADQMTGAMEAAHELCTAGDLGTGVFRVSLSGHANPDHKPRAGSWANDTVNISICQVAAE